MCALGVCVGRVCALSVCVGRVCALSVCVGRVCALGGNVFSASEVQLNTYSHFIRSVHINA